MNIPAVTTPVVAPNCTNSARNVPLPLSRIVGLGNLVLSITGSLLLLIVPVAR